MELFRKELNFKIGGGTWHTNFWDKIYLRSCSQLSAAVQHQCSATPEWHRAVVTVTARWHQLLQLDQVSSGAQREGTISSHLRWDVPPQHLQLRLHLLGWSLPLQALRVPSNDLSDLSFLLWAWLKRKHKAKQQPQQQQNKQTNITKKPPQNTIKQKRTNAKNTELGSHLTSASYTILGGRSACTIPFPFLWLAKIQFS